MLLNSTTNGGLAIGLNQTDRTHWDLMEFMRNETGNKEKGALGLIRPHDPYA